MEDLLASENRRLYECPSQWGTNSKLGGTLFSWIVGAMDNFPTIITVPGMY